MLTIDDLFPQEVNLPLKHPITGNELGVSLRVVCYDSAQCFDVQQAQLSEKSYTAMTLAERWAMENEITAATIVGWSSDEFFKGPYSKEKALELIKNPGFKWLKDQVERFVEDRKNFFREDVSAA